jgi:hypothetical protein
MADKFQLTGSWSANPATGSLLASGAASFAAPISESVMLAQKNYDDYTLDADAVQAVAFGGVADAHVVLIFSDRKIAIRLTSADGATQVVPCDGFLGLISETVPFTAIDIQRVAGQETKVKVFIGEKTS